MVRKILSFLCLFSVLVPPGLAVTAGGCRRRAQEHAMNADNQQTLQTEKAMFAAGCFWGVEEAFAKAPGVISTTVGYAGGHTDHPTYKQVCSGTTGHAEVVQVVYDARGTCYEALLELFWRIHDPTTLNRQGPDVGSQYRSVIFFYTPAQQTSAQASKDRVAGQFARPIVTLIQPAGRFWPAEEYHQRYFEKHGGGGCHLPR